MCTTMLLCPTTHHHALNNRRQLNHEIIIADFTGTMLYNVHDDPKQDYPLGPESVDIEKLMIRQLITLMQSVDSPAEQ